jgi:D-inositol-3-phosphate glycosyltransferase
MRVAMLSVHTSPLAGLGGKEAGGMNVYVRELSRELGRRGIIVDIFTRSQDPQSPRITAVDRNVTLVTLPAGPEAPYDKNLILDHHAEFVDGMQNYAQQHHFHYDIIHSHYFVSGIIGLALRDAWGIPLVHMFHTLGAMKNHVARSDEERETGQRIALEGRLMREADVVVAATPLDLQQMVWHYEAVPDRIKIIPCGVDLKRFHPHDMAEARAALGLPAQPTPIVLLVGRIEPLKGIDALIRAVARVRHHYPQLADTTAVVIGGASDEQPELWNSEQRRLDQIRTELGIRHAIKFIGARPQSQLALYHAAANVVTMPSHYESFGMAALEALASGRPVIATSAGGPATIINDGINGLLTMPDDAPALAANLVRVLADAHFAHRLGLAARERAQRYDWSNIGCDVLEVYRHQIRAHSNITHACASC